MKIYQDIVNKGFSNSTYVKAQLALIQVYSTEDQSSAYSFLANFHLKIGNLEEAFFAAQKCTKYDETKESTKNVLPQDAFRNPHSNTEEANSTARCSTPVLRLLTLN